MSAQILILVLSAMRDPWADMLQVQNETWDAEVHSQTSTVYYCGKTRKAGDNPRVFYSPTHDEELERVSARTLEAFEYALSMPCWDFLARPHSSTYVHKRNLADFIGTLPQENTLCGLLTTGEQPFLWGGGSYIMSRDVIEKFVENKDKWDLGIMEDNSMTNLANELGIPFTNGRMASINETPDGVSYDVVVYGIGEGFNFTDWNDINKAQPHFFFRCKQDLKRYKDLAIMKKLHEFYK